MGVALNHSSAVCTKGPARFSQIALSQLPAAARAAAAGALSAPTSKAFKASVRRTTPKLGQICHVELATADMPGAPGGYSLFETPGGFGGGLSGCSQKTLPPVLDYIKSNSDL